MLTEHSSWPSHSAHWARASLLRLSISDWREEESTLILSTFHMESAEPSTHLSGKKKKKCPCFDRAPYFCVRWSVAFIVVIRLSTLKMLQSDAGAVMMRMMRTDLFQFSMSLVFIISTCRHQSTDLFIHFNSWLGFSRNGFIRIRILNHLMLFLHGWFHGWMDAWRMHGWMHG